MLCCVCFTQKRDQVSAHHVTTLFSVNFISKNQLTAGFNLHMTIVCIIGTEASIGISVPPIPKPIWYMEAARQVVAQVVGSQEDVRGREAW